MNASKLPKIFLLCCLIFCAGASAFSAPRYYFDVWTNQNGLPQNNVQAVLQTRDGYLWFTTLDGLVRYDGVRFVTFTTGNTKGVLSNRFSSLFEDREGTLWIGTEDAGVVRYKNSSFQTFLNKDGLPDDSIRNFLVDEKGGLVATTKAGLARWDGEKFVRIRFNNQPVEDNALIFQGQGGTFLTVKNKTLIRLYSADNIREQTNLPVNFVEDYLTTVFEDSKKNLWVCHKDGRVFRFSNGVWNVYDKQNALLGKFVNLIYEDSKGILWFGTLDGGLYRYANDEFSVYTTNDGLPENHVVAIYEDREGTIWIGTNAGGLAHLNAQIISVIGKRDGLTGDGVYPIYQDREGNIWVGAGASGLNKIDAKQKITTFTEEEDGLPHDNVLSIQEDSAGRFWFGAVGGLNVFQNGKFTDFSSRTGLPYKNFNVWVIKEDRKGRLWFGTDRGLLVYANEQIKHYTTESGLASNEVKTILEARDGTLWLGTYGGLSRFNENGTFKSITEKDGLSGNKVRSIFEDKNGAFWIGSYDAGLTRMKDGRFTRYTMNEGLASNGAFQILEDDKGYFWISSNQGISRVSRTELNDFADGKIKKVSALMFGKRDGLQNAECNGGSQPAGIKTRDGRLWIPTQGGVAVVDPNALQTSSFAPPVLIESAMIDRRDVTLNQSIELNPQQSNLEIIYTGLSFIKPERVRFKYKLEGLDADWTDAGTRRSAYYAHLPPGSYTFRVIAANSDGVWNETGASVRVTVHPPFWRTWWFFSLVILSVAGLILFIYQRRVSHLKRDREAQIVFTRKLIDAQEQERKRIATELHDGLGQNLLVIKNWALLAIQKKKSEDEKLLEEISSTASQAIEETRSIAYNLRPYQIDEIGLTRAIEGMLNRINAASTINFKWQFDDVDGLFPKELEINLFRIVQECVNNIIKHSGASEANVGLECASDSLTLIIEDNGRGFDVSMNGHKKGLGLTGLQERARMLGGELIIQSEHGKGTKMVFRFSFSK